VGLLDRLLGRTSASDAIDVRTPTIRATLYVGDETLEVVGESHYQDALWRIVGGVREEHVRHEIHAVLMPEPDNAYDPNAIRVLVDGSVVGYLSREDAAAYRPGLLLLMKTNPGTLIALNGVIVGGGERPDGLGRLGVFLDHDPADFGIRPKHTRHNGGLRTGFSEAMATDLEDDSYDLSWYRELSGDDITDIKKLRAMLGTENEAIDRHYMLSELERRLYRSRDAFASALDEFDAVCRQHDAEMVTIRPALIEKLGEVPLIDMYRQAAVRCQKARNWETMRSWAERGITVYGADAARPEAVADLQKRLGYANAKIEAASAPKPPRPRRVAVRTAPLRTGGEIDGAIETLLCTQCGAAFQRLRTRGRKPHACPACRGLKPQAL
jgi:HIRAN domain